MLKDKSKVDVIYAHRSFIQMFNVSYTLMTFKGYKSFPSNTISTLFSVRDLYSWNLIAVNDRGLVGNL